MNGTKRLLILLCFLSVLAFVCRAQTKSPPTEFWVNTLQSAYQFPVAAGISGCPWNDSVRWSVGLKYMMDWPYNIGIGIGGHMVVSEFYQRFGLYLQRSASWPHQWENVGWEVTLLQTYSADDTSPASEYIIVELMPGLYYQHKIGPVKVKWMGFLGLNAGYGYLAILASPPAPSPRQYSLGVRITGGAGVTVSWPRKVLE